MRRARHGRTAMMWEVRIFQLAFDFYPRIGILAYEAGTGDHQRKASGRGSKTAGEKAPTMDRILVGGLKPISRRGEEGDGPCPAFGAARAEGTQRQAIARL